MTVDDHFNQEDFIMYSKLEELIIKAATKTDYTKELQEVIEFYGADFNASDLETHLELLYNGLFSLGANFQNELTAWENLFWAV